MTEETSVEVSSPSEVLIRDVFRRADKDDDEKISWIEFKTFFHDMGLSKADLRVLFDEIDSHNTNNIDVGELSTFFTANMGKFREVFNAISALNMAVGDVLRTSSQEYSSAASSHQFAIRFLLRETLNQLVAVQRPVDAASDVLDHLACQNSETGAEQNGEKDSSEMDGGGRDIESETRTPLRSGREARRAKRGYQTQTSWPPTSFSSERQADASQGTYCLGSDLERFSRLLDRLERRVNFEGFTDERTLSKTREKMLFMVRRQLECPESADCTETFTIYLESVQRASALLHVSIRAYTDSPTVLIYEIWSTRSALAKHEESDLLKHLKSCCIETSPLISSTMEIPNFPKNHLNAMKTKNKLKCVGECGTDNFQRIVCCAEDLYAQNPSEFEEPECDALTEFEWSCFKIKTIKELGGELWSFDEVAFVFLNGDLLGGSHVFIDWAKSQYQWCDFRPDSLYATLAEESYCERMSRPGMCHVYMDVTIDGEDAGKIVFELLSEKFPSTVQNFVCLCTGEMGKSEDSGFSLTYKDSIFHRIVPEGWIQGGDIWRGKGDGGESVFGYNFPDESYCLPHNKKGVLGMANNGNKHTNQSQFYITLNPAPWMDTRFVAFGYVVEGSAVIKKISELETLNERPKKEVKITDCGVYTVKF